MNKIEKIIEKNRIHHFEGSQGVNNLNLISYELGYKGGLTEFLADNPGAQEAIMEFMHQFFGGEDTEEEG